MIIINPEFHRNLWLNFTPFRLLAMPIIVGLIIFAFMVTTKNWQESIFVPATFLYFITVFLRGNYEAASSLFSEVKNNTWDFQKMSSIGPWELSLGKLLGTNSYVWYFGLTFLALSTYAYGFTDSFLTQYSKSALHPQITFAFNMLFAGLIGHAAAFLISIQSFQQSKGSVATAFIIGFCVSNYAISTTNGLNLLSYRTNKPPQLSETIWHGIAVEESLFMTLSLFFFSFWIIVAIYRNMRSELQFKNSSFIWLIFTASIAIYTSGFFNGLDENFTNINESINAKYIVGFLTVTTLTYLILLTEAGDLAKYKRWIFSIKSKNWNKALVDTPAWFSAIVLLLPLFILTNINGPSKEVSANENFSLLYLTLGIILFLVRDGFILHAVLLGNRIKHSRFVILFYYLMVYALLPFITYSVIQQTFEGNRNELRETAQQVMQLFFPFGLGSFAMTCLPALLQVFLAAFIFKRSLKS